MPRPKFSDRFQPIREWAEKNIYLDPNAPIPGRLRLFPWQIPILEAYQDHRVQQVTLMMSSQIGKSFIFLVILFYHVDSSPQNIFFVMATEKTLKRWRSEKMQPVLDSSPRINKKMHKTNRGTIPVDEMPFDGGTIYVAYSGSPASLRSIGVPLMLADEVDLYKGNLDTANPLSIIWQRGMRYGERRKLIAASTPTAEGSSRIEQEFNAGSQEYYYLPCWHCKAEHTLEWDNVREGKLYCPGCAAEIEEYMRREMLEAGGRWIPEKENISHKSYHINQLYTVEDTIANIAKEYDPKNPRGFWTQVLGKPYRSADDSVITPDGVKDLYSEEWDIGEGPIDPQAADIITAAVDVQQNRLELLFVHWKGWFPRAEKLVRIPIAYNEDMDAKTVKENQGFAYQKLNQELMKANPDFICVDRHYPSPDEVNALIQEHCSFWLSMQKMWLIVGSDNTFGEPFIKKMPTPKEPYYATLSVDTVKGWVHDVVRNKTMSINPDGVSEDFAEQLSAEELRYTVTSTGRETLRWVKTKRLNEALDLMVYNACARRALGEDYKRAALLSYDDLTSLLSPG